MTEPRHATFDEVPVTSGNLKEAVAEAFNTVQVDPFAVTAWGTAPVKEVTLTVPSGQKVLLRKLDPIDLIAADLVDEMDYFSKKLFPNAVDRAGNPVENEDDSTDEAGLWAMLKDEDKRTHFFKLLDGMAVAGCIKPPLTHDKEDSTKVFVGNLDFNDKMAIFTKLQEPVSRVGAFRQQSTPSVESVETGESL